MATAEEKAESARDALVAAAYLRMVRGQPDDFHELAQAIATNPYPENFVQTTDFKRTRHGARRDSQKAEREAKKELTKRLSQVNREARDARVMVAEGISPRKTFHDIYQFTKRVHQAEILQQRLKSPAAKIPMVRKQIEKKLVALHTSSKLGKTQDRHIQRAETLRDISAKMDVLVDTHVAAGRAQAETDAHRSHYNRGEEARRAFDAFAPTAEQLFNSEGEPNSVGVKRQKEFERRRRIFEHAVGEQVDAELSGSRGDLLDALADSDVQPGRNGRPFPGTIQEQVQKLETESMRTSAHIADLKRRTVEASYALARYGEAAALWTALNQKAIPKTFVGKGIMWAKRKTFAHVELAAKQQLDKQVSKIAPKFAAKRFRRNRVRVAAATDYMDARKDAKAAEKDMPVMMKELIEVASHKGRVEMVRDGILVGLGQAVERDSLDSTRERHSEANDLQDRIPHGVFSDRERNAVLGKLYLEDPYTHSDSSGNKAASQAQQQSQQHGKQQQQQQAKPINRSNPDPFAFHF